MCRLKVGKIVTQLQGHEGPLSELALSSWVSSKTAEWDMYWNLGIKETSEVTVHD